MLPGVTRCCWSINLSHLSIFQDHDAHGPEFLKHMQRINAESGAKITVSIQWRVFSLGMESFAADTYSHSICMLEIVIVFNPKNSEKLQCANVTATHVYAHATNESTLNSIWYPLIDHEDCWKKVQQLQQFCGNKFSLSGCRDCCKRDHQDSVQFYLKACFCVICVFPFLVPTL